MSRALMTLLLIAALCFGCATTQRQPELIDAGLEPPVLHPGESGIIHVKVADRADEVTRVIGVILDDPRIEFHLQDNGENGDAKANDGIWSLMVDVPFLAVPDTYELELTAYTIRGDEVLIRMPEGGVAPLQTIIPIVIEQQPAE